MRIFGGDARRRRAHRAQSPFANRRKAATRPLRRLVARDASRVDARRGKRNSSRNHVKKNLRNLRISSGMESARRRGAGGGAGIRPAAPGECAARKAPRLRRRGGATRRTAPSSAPWRRPGPRTQVNAVAPRGNPRGSLRRGGVLQCVSATKAGFAGPLTNLTGQDSPVRRNTALRPSATFNSVRTELGRGQTRLGAPDRGFRRAS